MMQMRAKSLCSRLKCEVTLMLSMPKIQEVEGKNSLLR